MLTRLNGLANRWWSCCQPISIQKNRTDFLLYTKSREVLLLFFFSRNKNLVRQTKYRGPFFVYKHVNPTFCMKKKKNRNDFCINIKLEKSFYFKKSVRFCMNDFWYMLELHKYYIFVQGKTKMTLKLRPKKIGSTFCIYKKSELSIWCIYRKSDQFSVYSNICFWFFIYTEKLVRFLFTISDFLYTQKVPTIYCIKMGW